MWTTEIDPIRWTTNELLELGRQVEADPTLDRFKRQGRPLTNIEMLAVRLYREDQRRKAQEIVRDL